MTYRQNEISIAAKKILQGATSKTICFHGEMGAGKTTLIKALVKELGGVDAANSPTFGIVNEYHATDRSVLAYHFDFYRVEDEIEALDLGFEDYLNKDVWVFIEWPEKIKSFLPEDAFNIYIKIKDFETREISF